MLATTVEQVRALLAVCEEHGAVRVNLSRLPGGTLEGVMYANPGRPTSEGALGTVAVTNDGSGIVHVELKEPKL